MPALDSLISGGAIHISDRNKATPIKTLCGQALDKPTTRYLINAENFEKADCKVCRMSFFNETWTGEAEPEKEPDAEPVQEQAQEPISDAAAIDTILDAQKPRTTLFGNLAIPINKHEPGIAE
jgi:hypothetical protein